MDSESQHATKITSALADSRIYSSTKNDDIGYAHDCFNHFSQCPTFLFSQCCGNVDVKSRWSLQNQNRWTNNSAEPAERIENTFYGSLVLCRHSVDLGFNEEVMKPERSKETPDHAGFKSNTMRVSKWYPKDDSQG